LFPPVIEEDRVADYPHDTDYAANAAIWTAPQEDLAEQRTDVDPRREDDVEDIEPRWDRIDLDSMPADAPEEDVIEQSIDVPYDDDYE
jgi:hypothetical protein